MTERYTYFYTNDMFGYDYEVILHDLHQVHVPCRIVLTDKDLHDFDAKLFCIGDLPEDQRLPETQRLIASYFEEGN